MKIRLILLVLVFSLCSAKFLKAQDGNIITPSDTLVVLWSSGDADVAEKACLMYAHAAKKNNWFKEVIVIVWGPSERLLTENSKLKDKIAAMKKDGVIVEACIACANMLGVTSDLKECGVEVRGMGVPLTRYLKRGYRVVSY